MKNNVLFKGIMPALVSPVDENGKVKEKELRDILRWESSFGVHGFYLCGSTGEGFHLTNEARKKILDITLEEVGGKLSVICNTGAVRLEDTLELTKYAHDAGADAVSAVPPIYYLYGEKEVFDYYKTIADTAEGTPFLVYSYGSKIVSYETVKQYLTIDNIIGLKWTNPDYYTMLKIKMLNGGNVNVINGPDETLICGLAAGADGGIGTTYNVMPGAFVELYNSFRSGNIEHAIKCQHAITSVINIMIDHHAITSTKAILTGLGFDVGQCTKPLRQFDDAEIKQIMDECAQFIDFKTQKLKI